MPTSVANLLFIPEAQKKLVVTTPPWLETSIPSLVSIIKHNSVGFLYPPTIVTANVQYRYRKWVVQR